MPKYTIDFQNNQKASRILNAIHGLYPPPVAPDDSQLFTQKEWGIEYLRMHFENLVSKWETRQAQRAVVVPRDPSIVIITEEA